MNTFFLAALIAASLAQINTASADPADSHFASKARAVLQPYAESDLFSGAVLVAHDGKPIFREAYGLANREWSVPNTADTKFRLGSITKQFTATAILQLAEQGKISIDDPVSKYYPAAPEAWEKITIRNLLTHTSGIPGYDIQARIDRSPEEIIKLIRDRPLQFEPGTQYVYNNTGYIVLGYIIEEISGESYADYLQHHIFGPLGMNNSGYDSATTLIDRRASGYRYSNGTWTNAPFLSMALPYAAGSLYSTVDDLLTWDQALYAAKPLTAASLDLMFRDYGHKYGFGWQLDQRFNRRIIYHGGGINGFRTTIDRFPDDKLTVIVLANDEPASPEAIAFDLEATYFGMAIAQTSVALPPSLLDKYVGQYENSPAYITTVTRVGDRLFAQGTGLPRAELFAKGPGEFFFKVFNDYQISFKSDGAGKVIALIDHSSAGDRTVPKIDEATATKLRDTLAQRVRERIPAPGSEAALRRSILAIQRGHPEYDRMSPPLAGGIRQVLSQDVQILSPLGRIETVTFQGVDLEGLGDRYTVKFEKGAPEEWQIIMGTDGTIESLSFQLAP